MAKNGFIKGAMLLIIFNLVGKIIGAVYRIPLANIVGSVGMGKYQLAFPLYCLILTISTSGIPVAISKLVAEYNSKNRFKDSKRLLRISILILTVISAIGMIVVIFGAKFIAKIQGNASNYICYYGIAPAILFVGVLSAFRGYFQGNLLMFPTAFSGFIEQVFKMVCGLYLAKRLIVYGTEFAVLGALIGISISELFAFIFLLFCYIFYSRKHNHMQEISMLSYRHLTKNLINISVPVTLGGLITPVTSMIDSLLVVNILMYRGFSNSNATMLLGIQSGVVEPLINLPVVIAISLSTVLLPNLSSLLAKNSKTEIKNLIERAYQICLSIAITCAICFVIFGGQILSFLYGRSFDPNELGIAIKLLFLGSLNIIFLSLVQVTASVLQGMNKQKYPVKSLLIGCSIKIVLDVVLLLIQPINIMGAVISGGVCYLVVFMLNYNMVKKLTGATLSNSFFYVSIQACFVCMFAYFSNLLFKMVFSEMIAMFIAGILAVLVFATTFYVFFMGKSGEYGFENKIN